MKKISIVSSCYNEELNVIELYERTKKVFEFFKDKYEFEYILADNGSNDNTALKLKELAKLDKRIKVIINSKNFGHIRSPFYVFKQAKGQAVITIASDLQDPPELIIDLIRKWEEGNEIVMLQKETSEENPIVFNLRKFYYNSLKKMSDSGVELAINCTGSGLYDRKVANYINQINDPYPFFRGLVCEAGFKRAYVQFKQPKRKRGLSANCFYTMYDIGMLGIVKYTKFPLRLMALLGFLMSILSFITGIFYFVWKILFWNTFSFGLAPLIISILFISSIQLFCLGVLGEYVGAIYTRIDKKPLVVEKERINF